MFVLAVLALLIAELRYAEGNKVMAYIFVALGVSLLVRAWTRWRNEKRPS